MTNDKQVFLAVSLALMEVTPEGLIEDLAT